MIDPLNRFTLLFTALPLVTAMALVFAPRLSSFRQWGTTNPGRLQVGIFISAWFLCWLAAAGIATRLLYVITYFYFDTTFGLVPGVTREIVQSHSWDLLVEVWLRQLFGWFLPDACFSTTALACQLGNAVGNTGSLGISPAILALFPAGLIALLARWAVSRRASKTMPILSLLALLLAACAPSPLQVPESTATFPPELSTLPVSSPISSLTLTLNAPSAVVPPPQITDTITPAETLAIPSPTDTSSPTPTPAITCERETASLSLSASTVSLNVGETVKVTATVKNEGCLSLGLPQYRLSIQSDGQPSILIPENPEPVVHYLAVNPGQSDSAEFDLTAVTGGQATLTASVSYEVHIGYPGPAYWGYTGTREPFVITVEP